MMAKYDVDDFSPPVDQRWSYFKWSRLYRHNTDNFPQPVNAILVHTCFLSNVLVHLIPGDWWLRLSEDTWAY